jgi:hypothetical protein
MQADRQTGGRKRKTQWERGIMYVPAKNNKVRKNSKKMSRKKRTRFNR